jgi:hypothetical protein
MAFCNDLVRREEAVEIQRALDVEREKVRSHYFWYDFFVDLVWCGDDLISNNL